MLVIRGRSRKKSTQKERVSIHKLIFTFNQGLENRHSQTEVDVEEVLKVPEGDELGVHQNGTEEGEEEFPHLRAPLHIPPPDLRQERLGGRHIEMSRFAIYSIYCSL